MGMKFRAVHGSSGLYKKTCFGYKKDNEGNLVPDEEQAKIVKRIYELYLSGTSIIGIIRTLAGEKIPSPQGIETWSKKTISTILTNTKYTGNVQVLKESCTVIFLDVPLSAIKYRLRNDTKRPLLQRPDKDRVMEELYNQRMPLYLKAADYRIDATKSPIIVAKDICKIIKK